MQLDKAVAFVVVFHPTCTVCVHMCAYSVLWSAQRRQRANKHNHYNVFHAETCKIMMKVRPVVLMKEKANCAVKPEFKVKCNICDCVFCNNSNSSIQTALQQRCGQFIMTCEVIFDLLLISCPSSTCTCQCVNKQYANVQEVMQPCQAPTLYSMWFIDFCCTNPHTDTHTHML